MYERVGCRTAVGPASASRCSGRPTGCAPGRHPLVRSPSCNHLTRASIPVPAVSRLRAGDRDRKDHRPHAGEWLTESQRRVRACRACRCELRRRCARCGPGCVGVDSRAQALCLSVFKYRVQKPVVARAWPSRWWRMSISRASLAKCLTMESAATQSGSAPARCRRRIGFHVLFPNCTQLTTVPEVAEKPPAGPTVEGFR